MVAPPSDRRFGNARTPQPRRIAVAQTSAAPKHVDRSAHPPLAKLRFPGCRRFQLSASELDGFDARIEFWDADVKAAWQLNSPTEPHDAAIHRLGRLTERVAALSGAPIESPAALRVVVRNAGGTPQRVMQPDRAIFLGPTPARTERGSVDVDADALPDVALEVDHTTDALSGKLAV